MGLNLRPSPIAGTWYSGERKALARDVDGFIEAAQFPPLLGEVIAVIAPHAGHEYSGPVAGYSFAAVRGSGPDVVAVLSPFHSYHHAPLLTPAYDAYATPLGNVVIDKAALDHLEKTLEEAGGPGITRISNDPEHSLEIELPFLQRVLTSDWKLLPLMVCTHDAPTLRIVAKALADVLRGRKALMVASTDLSHYKDQQTALTMDRALLAQVEKYETETLFDLERSGRGSACGLAALATVMWAARDLGADKIEILRHATSGDITGEFFSVVGYAGAAILKTQ